MSYLQWKRTLPEKILIRNRGKALELLWHVVPVHYVEAGHEINRQQFLRSVYAARGAYDPHGFLLLEANIELHSRAMLYH